MATYSQGSEATAQPAARTANATAPRMSRRSAPVRLASAGKASISGTSTIAPGAKTKPTMADPEPSSTRWTDTNVVTAETDVQTTTEPTNRRSSVGSRTRRRGPDPRRSTRFRLSDPPTDPAGAPPPPPSRQRPGPRTGRAPPGPVRP